MIIITINNGREKEVEKILIQKSIAPKLTVTRLVLTKARSQDSVKIPRMVAGSQLPEPSPAAFQGAPEQEAT